MSVPDGAGPVTACVLSRIIQPGIAQDGYATVAMSFPVIISRRAGKGCLLAATLIAALVLSSCGGGRGFGGSGGENLNTPPVDYKTDILAIARTYLNSPRKIRDAGITEPFLKEVGRGERYIVCVRADVTNSDGKFTGSRARAAVFRRGRLDQFIEAAPEPSSRGAGEIFATPEAADPCAGAVYQPFPELEKLSSQPPG